VTSLELSELFENTANKMVLSEDFETVLDFKQMGYWWYEKHKLDKEFERIIKYPFIFELIFFPYFIYVWQRYYKRSKLLDNQYENLNLIIKTNSEKE
jgi:hypothetical protein